MKWKREQGYEEPEECKFCEHFKPFRGGDGACKYGVDDMDWTSLCNQRYCKERGTCLHFDRKGL